MQSSDDLTGPHKAPPDVAPTGWCRWEEDGEACDEHATGWMLEPGYGWVPACDEHAAWRYTGDDPKPRRDE